MQFDVKTLVGLFELVKRNFDKIPQSYKKYAELSEILYLRSEFRVDKTTINKEYICDMGAEGSVIMFDGATNEEIEYTNNERVALIRLLALNVDVSSYDYIYQMGVRNPSELQILNAILHFDESEFL